MKSELSIGWAQGDPKDADEADQELDDMQSQCTQRQQQRRELAFVEAHRFVSHARELGGVLSPISESFCKYSRRRASDHTDARVVIEVLAGRAFV